LSVVPTNIVLIGILL